MPGVGLGGATYVQMDQLVEERLQDVTGADSGVDGDREAKLGGDGEAEAIWALAGPSHLELGLPCRERALGEDGQGSQPF